MSTKLKNPLVWLHGLVSALIGGIATSISTIVVAPEVFNLNGGLMNVLKVALVSGIVSAAMYLKQSPVPAIEDDTTPPPSTPPLGLLLALLLPLGLVTGVTGCKNLTVYDGIVTIKDAGETIRKEYVILYDAGLVTPEQHERVAGIYAEYQSAMRALRIVLESAAAGGPDAEVTVKLRAAKDAIRPLLAIISPLITADRAEKLNRNLNLASP